MFPTLRHAFPHDPPSHAHGVARPGQYSAMPECLNVCMRLVGSGPHEGGAPTCMILMSIVLNAPPVGSELLLAPPVLVIL